MDSRMDSWIDSQRDSLMKSRLREVELRPWGSTQINRVIGGLVTHPTRRLGVIITEEATFTGTHVLRRGQRGLVAAR